MKLEVLQENFSKALNYSSHFISTRAQLPVLNNVLLKTKKNKLLISATNLEISSSISIGAKVEKEGEIAIPAKTLTDIITSLPQGAISLESSRERLKIEAVGFKSTLSGINSADFPKVPISLGKDTVKLPTKEFLESLPYVLFSVSLDETRPVLNGVLFIFSKGKLKLVSTDGFRLSQCLVNAKIDIKDKSVILPKPVLSELQRASDDSGEHILMEFREKDNQVVFGFGSTVLSSRVIEGEFPNFEKIIPTANDIKVNLDKEDLSRSVKLASVFAREAANAIKFSLSGEGLEIQAESSKSGNQMSTIDAKVEGMPKNAKKLEIAYNYRYLEEFLKVIKSKDVQVDLSTPNAPGVFTNPKNKSFLHLIMPVKLQS